MLSIRPYNWSNWSFFDRASTSICWARFSAAREESSAIYTKWQTKWLARLHSRFKIVKMRSDNKINSTLELIKKSFKIWDKKEYERWCSRKSDWNLDMIFTTLYDRLRYTYTIFRLKRFVLGLDITTSWYCSILRYFCGWATCCNYWCVSNCTIHTSGFGSHFTSSLFQISPETLTFVPKLEIVSLTLIIFFLYLIGATFSSDNPTMKLFCLTDLCI